MDGDNTTKLPTMAELTYDKFRVLFKELFAESMDENMAKINCKLGELKAEMSDKVEKVKYECDDKIEKMKINHSEEVEQINGELHDIKLMNEELIKKNVGLQEEISKLRNDTVNNFRGLLELHQDAHRNSLKLTGVPETPMKRDPTTHNMSRENTEEVVRNLLKEKMGTNIKTEDLDFAKRIPRPVKQRDRGTPRAIVVKFMRHSDRQKVIANRRCLKGSGIGVHEVLTKHSQYIYDQARDMAKSAEEVQSVWTWNGITHVLAEDKQKTYRYQVRSIHDILEIAKKHSSKADSKIDSMEGSKVDSKEDSKVDSKEDSKDSSDSDTDAD